MIDLKAIEDFFFEASRKTYAGQAAKETIPALPGSKTFRYERDNFLYLDTYFTHGEKSFGQTIIYFNGQPVWMMQYYGFDKVDDKRVIPFLKKALLSAYENNSFVGGRGPAHFSEGILQYRNMISRSRFEDFEGEEIIAENHITLFWHGYRGMALI